MSVINLLRRRAPVHVNVKALHKLFDALILNANPFQIQNAPNCRYTPKKLMRLLVYASLERHTIEIICTLFSVNGGSPSASALRNALSHHHSSKIDALVNEYLLTTLKKLKRFSYSTKRRPSAVIVDFHDDYYYGKTESPYIIIGKHIKGTNTFFRYATVCLIEKGVIYTLGMRSVEKTATRFEIMKDLIEQAKKLVNVKIVLADAAFYNVKIVRFLDQEGITAIIRGVRNKSVKRLMESYKGTLEKERSHKRISYVMRRHGNKNPYEVDLLLYRQEGKLRVLMVNKRCTLTADECIQLYKKRFSIETPYRMKHLVKAWTTSKKASLRTVIFGMSCLLYTFWAIYREVVAKSKQRYKCEEKAENRPYELRMWVLLAFIRLRIAPLLSPEGSLM